MKLHIDENSSTRVKRALFGDDTGKIKTFAILTAENPNSMKLSRKDNKSKMMDFKTRLKNLGLQYTKIQGHFDGNKENSIIVYNLSYEDAENYAKYYGQKSFFFGTNSMPSEITYYEATDDSCTKYRKIESTKKIENMKDADDFFSRHGDFKFSIDLKYFKDSIDKVCNSIIDESKLSVAIDDRYTSRGRMIARRQSRYDFND